MAVALAFARPDVDVFLDEIEHDQLSEWVAYFTLRPHGWEGTRMAVTRLSYIVAQVNSRKRLRESGFDLRTAAGNVQSAEVERARFRAQSIRSGIRNGEGKQLEDSDG